MPSRTGFVWHERYMWHVTGIAAGAVPAGGYVEPSMFHIEDPSSKRRIRNLLEVTGLLEELVSIRPRQATEAELLRVHDAAYLDRLERLSAEGVGDAGEKAPVGPDSLTIAKLAVGGCLEAADAIVRGQVANAYALVRPPGHHAERSRGRGFCLLANAALTVAHLKAVHSLERIAVVDWDVHHGNGTQSIFYEDPTVLTISVHEEGNYPPDSGTLVERGAGQGFGTNLNIPLPAGSGHGAYMETFERVIGPALRRFRPSMIVVPCGFDSCIFDPLARQMNVAETFRLLTRFVKSAAAELCEGRLLLTHEGGYSSFYTPYCGLAVIEELSGVRTDAEDPFGHHIAKPGQKLLLHQADVIAEAAAMVAEVPVPSSGGGGRIGRAAD
jgi:acetoin utilization deacetylase AcuC-like enzyme